MIERLKVILNEDGYTIYIAVAITLILTILGAALIVLVNNELVAVRRGLDYVKAYYVAEAGINHALWELNHQLLGDVSGSAGDGAYQTQYDGRSMVLRSTGTVNNIIRMITVKVKVAELPLAFDQAASIAKTSVIPGNDDPGANGNVTIIGGADPAKVIVLGYELLNIQGWIKNKDGTVGKVYSTEEKYQPTPNIGIHFLIGDEPNPLPEIPKLNTTSYDNKIASAASGGLVGNFTYTDLVIDGIANPNPLKIKGDVTISGTISGGTPEKPAELIVTKNVTLNNVTVEPYTTIIAGRDIEIKGNTTIKESSIDTDDNADSEFYSAFDFKINASGTIRATLISNYKFWIQTGGELNIYGPVFSTDQAKITVTNTSGRFNLRGSIVNGIKGEMIFDDIKGRVDIYFDKSFFPAYAPSAFRRYAGVSLDYSTWREK